jgi:ribokinase
MPTIVVVGSLNIDLVAFAERLPEAGETVIGTRFLQGFGGKGANQAVAAARFGARVEMVGAVGDDANGSAIVANLRREGVGVAEVAKVRGTSGVAPIWVDGGGRNRIIVVPGANDEVSDEAAAAAIDRIRPSVVVGQFEIPQPATAAAFLAARRVGATTILNPAPAAVLAPSLAASVEWLVPNETEFAGLAGGRLTGADVDDEHAIATVGRALGCGLVVTLGERGAMLRDRDGAVARIAAPSVRAVDTSGAGDAFVGAFAVGLALGWPADRAARLGCAAASESVTRLGTQASYADRVTAAALLATLEPE